MKLPFLNSHSSQNHTKHSVLGVLFGWLLISALVGQLISANELQNHSKFNELDRWYEVFLSGSKVGSCTLHYEVGEQCRLVRKYF